MNLKNGHAKRKHGILQGAEENYRIDIYSVFKV